MSSDAVKKRKSKVLRGEAATPEVKRGRVEGEPQDVRVYSEEVELDSRDAEQDYKQFKESCESLANLMSEIQNLKANGAKEGKEISKCLEFKSKHEEIDLVPEEEFYQEAPPDISRPSLTKSDSHQLTLARLDWELEQRKRLAEKYKDSLASKEKIQKSIEVKKEHLSSLQPGLTAIMQASLPVQQYLSMPFEQTQKQTEVARHLPPPLYVLFVQANAYGEACDKNLIVSISGDVDEAKALSKPPEDSQDDESDSDAEEEQEKTKRRRSTTGGQLDDKRREMLKRHPLSLCIELKCKGGPFHISVLVYCSEAVVGRLFLHSFCFHRWRHPLSLLLLPDEPEHYDSQDQGFHPHRSHLHHQDLLKSETLLSCLYAGDHGGETPNPANHYQFDKVGIVCFSDYVEELGHPYMWVQSLGGLQFPRAASESVCSGSSLSASQMETTMKLLKRRLQSRLALHRQFASLARLQAAVVLNPRYPEVSPLFSLSLSWKGERSGQTDDNLRAMESEVNVFKNELQGPHPGHQLLTNQISRLCVCLDVYLETEGQDDGVEGPREFPREKMCLRIVRYNSPVFARHAGSAGAVSGALTLCLPQGPQPPEAIQVQPPSGLLQSPLDLLTGRPLSGAAQLDPRLHFDFLTHTLEKSLNVFETIKILIQ
ncbi:unnamed protein product [Tetraodon nigroviridis]|uniref:(spotted green pufferfish) hypothetical protein n=1 Tax=Tetraodon nigroviridis TaxID=99883 RepID=Q4RSS1_TETNG|nr:unnamed protein product [Tetraodon nigroviridis]